MHELYLLLQETIIDMCRQHVISWTFMPADSSHFGGMYVAAVKSAKYHLRRTIDSAIFTYEELNAIIKQAKLTPLFYDLLVEKTSIVINDPNGNYDLINSHTRTISITAILRTAINDFLSS